jgi:hypothetical protein
MAQIQLGRYEAEEGELPTLCLRCGAPATLFKAKRFAWHPSWVYFLIPVAALPFFVAAALLTRRMRVLAPLCNAHKNHWVRRELFFAGGLLGLLVLLIAAVAVLVETGGLTGRWPGLLCVGWLGVLAAWIGVVFLTQLGAIRPKEITEYSITLAGAAPEFVAQFRREKSQGLTGLHRAMVNHDPTPSTLRRHYR